MPKPVFYLTKPLEHLDYSYLVIIAKNLKGFCLSQVFPANYSVSSSLSKKFHTIFPILAPKSSPKKVVRNEDCINTRSILDKEGFLRQHDNSEVT